MRSIEETKRLYILPFEKDDLYLISPLLGVKSDDYRYKNCQCYRCGSLLYVPFEDYELGVFEINVPFRRFAPLFGVTGSGNVFFQEEERFISISFFGKKLTKLQLENTVHSVVQTNEVDFFEIHVRDIRINICPKHICYTEV